MAAKSKVATKAKPKPAVDEPEVIATEPDPVDVVESIKGFNADWTCHGGYKFKLGRTYHVGGKISACENGFHACPTDGHPLSVFEYYAPAGARFAMVEQSGESDKDGDKLASATITIKAEISLGELTKRAIDWVFARAKWSDGPAVKADNEGVTVGGYSGAASATGDRGAASATGYSGAASATGDSGAASATGDRGAASATGDSGAASATGDRGAASATGDSGAASATGDRGAASATGDRGAASATGDRGAASATGDRGAASATGYRGAASATGDRGAASATGDRGAASATGKNGGAFTCGYGGRVMGALGCTLHADERDDDGNAISTASGIVGIDGIKADTWYSAKSSKLVEAE